MISIAIDGPGGAGKSTIARTLAKDMGYLYVDTGALYRAIGLYARRNGAAPGDTDRVTALLPDIQLDLRWVEGIQRVYLNGEDVSEEIRLPEISMAASDVSAMVPVRDFLLELQRGMARKHHVVMDGRDIGTVVLPDAQVKIFLTADPEERARRRCRELEEKGLPGDFQQVLAELRQRDQQDQNRAAAPLRQAEDAVLADTTGLTLEESLALVKRIVKERSGNDL